MLFLKHVWVNFTNSLAIHPHSVLIHDESSNIALSMVCINPFVYAIAIRNYVGTY